MEPSSDDACSVTSQVWQCGAGQRPDLILSDWNTPNRSGIEFLDILRAQGDSTRFGFVTSEGTDDMRVTAAETRAEFLIATPFDGDTFRCLLGAIVG